MGTFYDRRNYVVHLENLQYYLQKGMKLKKIHRVVRFKQKAFLKDFIEKVTELRSRARNDFELRLFKLFANSTFGKFIENVRKYVEVILCHNEGQLESALSGVGVSSNFHIINENLVTVMKKPDEIRLNKPLAVGFAILELSKLFMYRSYYDVFVPHFGPENISLCFSDTDSFLLHVKTDNLLKDMTKLKNRFDFSKYPSDHVLYDSSKANRLFYFKDEMRGEAAITRFIGLRPKCYSMQIRHLHGDGNSTKKVCKGVKRSAIRHKLSFDDYEKCLLRQCAVFKSFKNFRSKKHRIVTNFTRKIALSALDTKRYTLDCGYHTLALGNANIVTSLGKCYRCCTSSSSEKSSDK